MSDEVSRELFEEVASIIRDPNIPPARKSTQAEQLRLYGLYKRGTVGKLHPPYDDDDTDTDNRPKSRPGVLKWEARSKYDAWEEADKLTMNEARKEYVALAKELVGQPVEDVIQKHESQ